MKKKLLLGTIAVLTALAVMVGCAADPEETNYVTDNEVFTNAQGVWIKGDMVLSGNNNDPYWLQWYAPGEVTTEPQYIFGPRTIQAMSPGHNVGANLSMGTTFSRVLATRYSDAAYTGDFNADEDGSDEGVNLMAPRDWWNSKSEAVRRDMLSGDSHFLTDMYLPSATAGGSMSHDDKFHEIMRNETTGDGPAVKTWKDFPVFQRDVISRVVDIEDTIFDYATNRVLATLHYFLVEMKGVDRRNDEIHLYAVVIHGTYTGQYPRAKGVYVRPDKPNPNATLQDVTITAAGATATGVRITLSPPVKGLEVAINRTGQANFTFDAMFANLFGRVEVGSVIPRDNIGQTYDITWALFTQMTGGTALTSLAAYEADDTREHWINLVYLELPRAFRANLPITVWGKAAEDELEITVTTGGGIVAATINSDDVQDQFLVGSTTLAIEVPFMPELMNLTARNFAVELQNGRNAPITNLTGPGTINITAGTMVYTLTFAATTLVIDGEATVTMTTPVGIATTTFEIDVELGILRTRTSRVSDTELQSTVTLTRPLRNDETDLITVGGENVYTFDDSDAVAGSSEVNGFRIVDIEEFENSFADAPDEDDTVVMTVVSVTGVTVIIDWEADSGEWEVAADIDFWIEFGEGLNNGGHVKP